MHIVHIILWQISFWRWSSLVMLTHWSCFTFWLYSKNLWKNIQGQNSKYFFFFPLRKMMLLVRHRWPIFHFPWCCYPLSGGYLLQPKICIIPLFFKITDLHLHTVRKSQIVSKNYIFRKNNKSYEFELSRQKFNNFLLLLILKMTKITIFGATFAV